ncbi:hypothetical protein [Halobacillus ihumii]|uniref:hypothetical protein n=1 Tax=Halobacillus ihumii TaxID=2686092 RepID=UPI0013D8CE5C|nr:hypothetical protein [Halobacillus ihumii]
MRISKLKVSMFVLLIFVLIPSTVLASSGWDYVGSDSVYGTRDGSSASWSKTFYSTGGDFRVCLSGFDGNDANTTVRVWLKEMGGYDEVLSFYEIPAAEKIGPNGVACFEFRDIGEWVDGSNNKAEFQFKVQFYSDGQAEYVTGKTYD